MPRTLPLEELGLLQSGLITEGEPPLLTELGAMRLAELRLARDDLSSERETAKG